LSPAAELSLALKVERQTRVVDPQDLCAFFVNGYDAYGSRIHLEPVGEINRNPAVEQQCGLDDVSVAEQCNCFAGMSQPAVFQKSHHSRLHVDCEFPIWSGTAATEFVETNPIRVVIQFREAAARPIPHSRLNQAFVRFDRNVDPRGERRCSLHGPLERTRVDGANGSRSESVGDSLGLQTPFVIEVDPGTSSCEPFSDSIIVAVPEQKVSSHLYRTISGAADGPLGKCFAVAMVV
jgi:hypothetical protein